MKLIAHRGASLERPENSLEGLVLGSELGAYAVECDVRMTADGAYVIYHDDNLGRLGGSVKKVGEVTLGEMRELLAAKGKGLLTLDELLVGYRADAYVLLHIKLSDPDESLIRMLYESEVRFICGVQSVKATQTCRKYFPPEQILAFMPDLNMCVDFCRAGAGIIRIWENWLDRITPRQVRIACPGAEVFIMANSPDTGMDGTPASLDYFMSLGADGVLLNDIRMAAEHIKKKRTA